jgi:hypothetical protein
MVNREQKAKTPTQPCEAPDWSLWELYFVLLEVEPLTRNQLTVKRATL